MPVVDTSPAELRSKWRERITYSKQDQERFHGIWATNLAFAAGQHWLTWDKQSRQLRHIQDTGDPRYQGRELFTADRITEYRQAALGELTSDDDRPQLISAQDGSDPKRQASALNQLVSYGWDQEWNAADVIAQARRLCIDLGTSAIRCKWDPNAGPEKQQPAYVPMQAPGQPLSAEAIMALAKQGAMPDGSLPQFQKLAREGRTKWEVYSNFQIFTPPGVVHEDDFPWEVLARPVLVDEIADIYGVNVDEDTSIMSTAGLLTEQSLQSGAFNGRLRDHAWMYFCFQRPSARAPEGQTAVLAGADYQLCDAEGELPYKIAGEYRSGIVYMHWWRLSDRFRSRSLVESLKDPQRVINTRKVQNKELIDRGLPKLIVTQGSYPGDVTGAPLEIIELAPGASEPKPTTPIAPGGWMYQDIDSMDADLSHASTLSPLRLGENPTNVDTYAQLALLNDTEGGKRGSIQAEQRRSIGELVMLALVDVKKYWPEEKQAIIVGPEDTIQFVSLRKSQIPVEYLVKPATGAPQPRSQGAQVKKIDAIWTAAVQSGVVATDPQAWTAWYKDSIETGQAQELPSVGQSTQQALAELENQLMRQGEEVEPTYYDNLHTHLPIHRIEEDRARAAGDFELAARIERHNLQSIIVQQQGQAMLAQLIPAAPMGGPATTPGQGPASQNGTPPVFASGDYQRMQSGQ